MLYITQRLIFTATFLIVFATDGYLACFQSDEYHTSTIASGSAFYQECHCTETGYNAEHLIWLDNNNKIVATGPGTDSNIFVERLTDGINLHIMNISKSMSGTFKCVTHYKGQQYVQTYNVDAYEPLYFVNTDVNQHLVEGRDVRINCEPKGESEPIIRWYREKGELTEIHNSEKYEITPQGLIVKNVTRDDSGLYKCTALVITTGEEVDRFIKTEIMTIPIIQEVEAIPESTVVEGESLSIKCIAEGTPDAEYRWNKLRATDTNNTGNHTWQQLHNTIIFEHIKAEDEGTYECIAYNFAGNVSKSTSIEVLIPPKIHDFENITAREGEGIAIVCNATGRPQPKVTVTMERILSENEWENSTEIPPNTMTLVYPSHQGVYTCNASNEVGSITKDMYVTVMHQPYFDKYIENIWGWNEKIVNLSCITDSNPPATVTWRYKGNYVMTAEQMEMRKQLINALNSLSEKYITITINKNFSYGTYECTAENIYGQVTKSITIEEGFVPRAVKNISLIDTAATWVLFSIDGPEFIHGPAIIGYTAEYDESANYNITNIHVNRTWAVGRPFRLDKLKPNTTYYIRFAAMNEIGAGAWSEMLEFNTPDKSVPEEPVWDLDEAQLLRSDSKQVLKWKVPDDNGDPIDYYIIRYCPKNDPFDETLCREEIIEPTNELALNKFKSNTTYYLELIAHNAEGNSTAANITIDVPALALEESTILTLGIIIGIPILIVIICLLLLDVLLLLWRRQGIIASCCCKKKENVNSNLQSRDKKGLLKEKCESRDNTLRRTEKTHKEFEYDKTTGIITGKHSAV